jgi:uncharacterized protein YdaU (DUF1376 family)
MSDELRVDVFMPLYVRDFLTSTFGWTAEERGHYLTLLMLAWDRGGLPAELEQLERLSPGVTAAWPMLADKFPVSEDGQRRNLRLEKHRTKCVALKEKRVNAAKRAAAGRAASAGANDEQTQGSRGAIVEQTQGKRRATVNHPTPTPTPTSSKEEITHTHTPAEPDDFRQPGWADDEWQRFAAVWNVTERAEPWPHFTAPDGWVDLAATPGWLRRAREALARLPSRQYFDRPLPVTRFFDFVDRIRAGEFADPKGNARTRGRQPAGGNL